MNDWELDDDWEWDLEEEPDEVIYEWSEELSDRFFLSDNNYLPTSIADYSLGFLEPEEWEPLVRQLDGLVDLERILIIADAIQPLLQLPGLPTELLEMPLAWLESALEGNLPPEPTGRRVGSRRLVRLALLVVRLAQELPDTAQAAVRTWAEVHRAIERSADLESEEADETDLDLPPAVMGFSMMIAMTLMRWPKRAEGMPLPAEFARPEVYSEIMSRWEALPDSPTPQREGTGQAEALFAQGQLAHLLAQMGSLEATDSEEVEEAELSLAYSRLSRAILWVHTQCRHCPAREGMACTVAVNGPEHPVPLLDISAEIANTGRIEGCIKI